MQDEVSETIYLILRFEYKLPTENLTQFRNMTQLFLLCVVLLFAGNVESFRSLKQSTRGSIKMSANIFDISSILTSELFSSPSARFVALYKVYHSFIPACRSERS